LLMQFLRNSLGALGLLSLCGAALPTSTSEPVQTYWPNGELHESYAVDEEGARTGPYQSFYQDGSRHVRSRYRNGLLDGAYDSWHADGERWIETGYKMGELHGRYCERFEGSERTYEGRYKNGCADGEFELSEDRELLLVQEWDDGSLVEIAGVAAHTRSQEQLALGLEGIRTQRPEVADEPLERERDAALARLQQYRFLCRVPWEELARDELMDAHAQAGAELCERIGRLEHTPENPGMDEDDYRFAYKGTSSSNLSMGPPIPGSIDDYMDDSSPRNIGRVGHRRWCLNPPMRRTGFGKAGRFSAMWSFDRSGGGTHREPILYPPAGYVPNDMFGPRHAWSVMLPGGAGRRASMAQLSITITELDERYLPVGEALELDHENNSNGLLIFRPTGLSTEPGTRYLARLDGLPGKGEEAQLVWLVEFVEAGGGPLPDELR